jgi:hypothetical protein
MGRLLRLTARQRKCGIPILSIPDLSFSLSALLTCPPPMSEHSSVEDKRIRRRTVVQNPVRADEADVQWHAPAPQMADDLEVLNGAAGNRRCLINVGELIQLQFDPRAARPTPGVCADFPEWNNKTLTGSSALSRLYLPLSGMTSTSHSSRNGCQGCSVQMLKPVQVSFGSDVCFGSGLNPMILLRIRSKC